MNTLQAQLKTRELFPRDAKTVSLFQPLIQHQYFHWIPVFFMFTRTQKMTLKVGKMRQLCTSISGIFQMTALEMEYVKFRCFFLMPWFTCRVIQNIIVCYIMCSPVRYMSVFSYYKTGSDTASYKMLLGSVLKNTAKDSWGARKSGRNVSLQADSGVGEGERVHLCMLNHNQAGT